MVRLAVMRARRRPDPGSAANDVTQLGDAFSALLASFVPPQPNKAGSKMTQNRIIYSRSFSKLNLTRLIVLVFAASLLTTLNSSAYADESASTPTITPRSAESGNEIGAVLEPFEIHPEQYVSAWCMISTGNLKKTGARLADLIPDGEPLVGMAKRAVVNAVAHDKGDVMCVGRVTSTPIRMIDGWRLHLRGQKANAALSLNFKSWADGEPKAHETHKCKIFRSQCLHMNRRGSPESVDAMSACIEVTDRQDGAVGSVVFVIENNDDDTEQKVPESVKSDIGFQPKACANRAY